MAYLVRVDVKLGGEFRQSLVFAKRGQNDLRLFDRLARGVVRHYDRVAHGNAAVAVVVLETGGEEERQGD